MNLKNLIFTIITSILSFSALTQENDLGIALTGKPVAKLSSVKIDYVLNRIPEDGQSIIMLMYLRQEDLDEFSGLHAIPVSELLLKDSTLNDLPEIPAGYYAKWIEKKSKWKLKKGGLKDIM